ncbi:hypothetical protein B5X24_HaOG204485 [Helicoverpa armigera]|uniref:Ornithine decarboxylase n=1 Tax=Helicoverpa armigera TaxID=29058 RepID=A0A2W1BUR1_HELAM|nr:hypothetical protein B5X24_HaOG204485 [Helicoverpa armigera]
MKVVEEEQLITVMDGPWSPTGLIREIVDSGTQEDPFYIMDLGEVVARRIIFANPAKMASHIRYASAMGVDVMTFDSETELMKIKQFMPHAQLVIRIRCDAAAAQCPLGIKFGCDPLTEAPRLLKLAAVLGLDVVGVSFHVGSGASETAVYGRGISLARALFRTARDAGHVRMQLLDIGGGFPGGRHDDIQEVAEVINAALEEHFPIGSVRVIAEPGRYFAAAAYTLAAMVHAKREIAPIESGGETHTMYFINDGVYGSFNCVLYDHQHVKAETLNDNGTPLSECSVWGPTCDGLDCVLPNVRLPTLAIGDWLVFRDMGAYTLPVASAFNGFPVPTVRPVVDARLASILKELRPLTASQFAATRSGATSGPPSPTAPGSPHAEAALSPPARAVFVECALK